jgi:hypothetical protein
MASAAYPVACYVFFFSFTFFILTQSHENSSLNHPISAFDAGWQLEILSLIARLPAGLYYSILFVQKMRAFRRLVLECFYKQKTTKITLNFQKIIEMQLNSSSQCKQLAMRQANKREKKQLRQREKFKFVCAHSGIEPTTLSVQSEFCSRIPPRLTRKIC